MLLEFHEYLDLKRLRQTARRLSRTDTIPLHEAHDRVAKVAYRDHLLNANMRPDMIDDEVAAYTWLGLMRQTWALDDDLILRNRANPRGCPGGLLVEIEAPLFGQKGVQGFLHGSTGSEIERFADYLSSDNELRFRVQVSPMGQGVRQRLTINRRMGCFDGGIACKGPHTANVPASARCCGRLELGRGELKPLRQAYERARYEKSFAGMAKWIVAAFGFQASLPMVQHNNQPAWISTTLLANDRLKLLTALDTDEMGSESGERAAAPLK